MVAVTLLLTIAAALILGVILGYAMITTILHAMRRRPQPVAERALVATDVVGGD
jgi:uncharacterized protein YneF (UPF0154 family)